MSLEEDRLSDGITLFSLVEGHVRTSPIQVNLIQMLDLFFYNDCLMLWAIVCLWSHLPLDAWHLDTDMLGRFVNRQALSNIARGLGVD